jgi:hypothetical protein
MTQALSPEIQKKFLQLACDLSPENLTCDGELPRSRVNQKLRILKAAWKALEKQVGRQVTEDEVWQAARQGGSHA